MTAARVVPRGSGGDRAAFVDEIRERLLGVVVAVVGLNVIWLVLGWTLEDDVWPSHRHAWDEFFLLATDGFQNRTLLAHVGATLGRVLFAMVVGGLIGGAIGAAIGSRRRARNLTDPFVSFVRFVSPSAVISIAIAIVGIGEVARLFAATLLVVCVMADGTARGVLQTSSRDKLVGWHLVSSARAALLVVWITITFNELIGAETGIGSAIWSARTFFRQGMIVALLLTSTVLFMAIDYVIRLGGRLFVAQSQPASTVVDLDLTPEPTSF